MSTDQYGPMLVMTAYSAGVLWAYSNPANGTEVFIALSLLPWIAYYFVHQQLACIEHERDEWRKKATKKALCTSQMPVAQAGTTHGLPIQKPHQIAESPLK